MWQEIHVEKEIFMVSSELMDDKWKILLTNLVELWFEDISREEIVDKCQRLNPLLSIEDVNIDEIMAGVLSNIVKLAVQVTKWKIKLETTVEVGELKRQKEMLIKELKRKDEEIMEYKANGAELIRKHIQTLPFNEHALEGDLSGDSPQRCLDIFKEAVTSRPQRPAASAPHSSVPIISKSFV
ncbi:uncharacterized protein [Fopius arisanus]|uniref:Nhej1_1 protein n=1 Tax=Fopius arisanus TaxID=64838 RepID=A0A0C9QC89_9HYME|nr:PREDICTED: uncharacterized protein LOC105265896 isoform X2 [Fopius arisanus]